MENQLTYNTRIEPIPKADQMRFLAEPFPLHDLKFRIGATNKRAQESSQADPKAMALVYIDARDVMDRLDKIIGPDNWQLDRKEVNGKTYTGIGIRFQGEEDFIWRWEPGYMAPTTAADQSAVILGEASVGVRRAGAAWGIGRYLYRIPRKSLWVSYNPSTKKLNQYPDLSEFPFCLPYQLQDEKTEEDLNLAQTETGDPDALTAGQIEPTDNGKEESKLNPGMVMSFLVVDQGVDPPVARRNLFALLEGGVTIEAAFSTLKGLLRRGELK